MENEQLASLHAIAQRFNLPPRWIKSEAEQGRIPVLKIGRRMLFNPEAVEQALAVRAAQGKAVRHAK